MNKFLLTLSLFTIGLGLMAQGQSKTSATAQFLFIIRFKADFVPPSADAVQKNIQHWQEYMADLGKSGKIAGGYCTGNNGITVTGTEKIEKRGPYVSSNELISSVLIINAASLEEARAISLKCPVFEFGGSVEVRPISMVNE